MRFDLRALADAMDADHYPGGDILREAAAEIQRLRNHLRLIEEERDEGIAEIERLTKELARFVPMFSASKNNLYARREATDE